MRIEFPSDRLPISRSDELVQTIHTMDDGQRLALAKELLQLINKSSQPGDGGLQDRDVLPFDPAFGEIQEPLPEGEEPSAAPARSPEYLRMLSALLKQLQEMLNTTFGNEATQKPGQQQGREFSTSSHPTKEKSINQDPAKNSNGVQKNFSENQIPSARRPQETTIISKVTQNTRQEFVPSSKSLQVDLSLKLLQINKLAQALVPRGDVHSAQREVNSVEIQLLAELGKLFGRIQALKNLIQGEKVPVITKFIEIVTQRINDITVKISSFGSVPMGKLPKSEQETLLQRLAQEVEWLASVDDIAHVPVASPEKQSGSEMPTLKGFLKTYQLEQTNQSKLNINEHKVVQIPKSAQEMAHIIQSHLVKGIPQPLPLMIPYPIPLAFNDSVSETRSVGEESKEKGKKGEKRVGSSNGSSQMMVLIPSGPVIVGDPFEEGRIDEQPTRIEQLEPFLIATTPVTNSQFAGWLSEALLRKTIIVEHPGKVYDTQGHLLCITNEGSPFSQIELAVQEGILFFKPLQTKDHHPVVHVTYYGAIAFCKSNGVRLPTEEEWERAAGMMPTAYGEPLKKLRYGCFSDSLNPSIAVYRETGSASSKQNNTTAVSFFDGEKVYTKEGERIETECASSPWGCFDMSGNVREWTCSGFDEDGLFITTKGGSYNDTVFDLRIPAKIPLSPMRSDPYTGFRVVL